MSATAAAAQRNTTPTAQDIANAAFQAQQPAESIVPELRGTYRQQGGDLVRTLATAGYAASDIATHLVNTDREAAADAVVWLMGAGNPADKAWDAVSRVSNEPLAATAAAVLARVGAGTRAERTLWSRSWRTSGLTATQVVGLFGGIGPLDPAVIAQSLKDAGYTSTQIAEALLDRATPQQILILLHDVGCTTEEMVQAAKDVFSLSTFQLLQAMIQAQAGEVHAALAIVAVYKYDGDVMAPPMKQADLSASVTLTVLATIAAGATTAVSLVSAITATIASIVAAALGAGYLSAEITASLAVAGVSAGTAAVALLGSVPLPESTASLRSGYDLSLDENATSQSNAGAAWPQLIEALDEVYQPLFADLVAVVSASLINQASVRSVLLELLRQKAEEEEEEMDDMVQALAEHAMSGPNLAEGLRNVVGVTADRIAELLVKAGFTGATAVASALKHAGYTNPITVASALKAASFSYAQVQAVLATVFTLTTQEIAQILTTVFGS